MPLRAAIEDRYPHQSPRALELRERIIEICQWYLDNGYGDGNAQQRLSSLDDNVYWQTLSEVLMAYQLREAGIEFTHQPVGPDFRVDWNGRCIWIEVITPTAANLPPEWLAPPGGGVREFPHQEILLRWTAAIKQKAEVLLGNPHGAGGYLPNGVVGPNDAYVIATNGRLLRGFGGGFGELVGISQFPFAVEATFAVGPLQVRIDRETLEAGDPEHLQRFLISKPVGQPVPADTFLDARFASISAVWATDIDEGSLIDRVPAMAVVHNPRALNPLPLRTLPAQDEYAARELDERSYQLERSDGIAANCSVLTVEVG